MRYPRMSLFQHCRFHQNWFHQLGLVIVFTRWPVLGLFRIAKLYNFHVSLFHLLGLKIGPQKLNSVSFLEHIHKFNLDLFIPRYSNSPQVSCLWMNSGRGWNSNLEGSYLPEYSESEVKVLIQCTSRFYRRPMQFSAPKPSPISGYRKCTKT